MFPVWSYCITHTSLPMAYSGYRACPGSEVLYAVWWRFRTVQVSISGEVNHTQ